MIETISRDVLEWAQDLSALRTLLAGEPLANPHKTDAVVVRPKFGTRLARSGAGER